MRMAMVWRCGVAGVVLMLMCAGGAAHAAVDRAEASLNDLAAEAKRWHAEPASDDRAAAMTELAGEALRRLDQVDDAKAALATKPWLTLLANVGEKFTPEQRKALAGELREVPEFAPDKVATLPVDRVVDVGEALARLDDADTAGLLVKTWIKSGDLNKVDDAMIARLAGLTGRKTGQVQLDDAGTRDAGE